VRWEDGRTLRYFIQFWYPDAVTRVSGMPRRREIYDGEERFIGMCFEIDPTREPYWVHDYAVRQQEAFAPAPRLENELDAVLFDNGALYRKDTRREADNFLAFHNAKQMLYKQVLTFVDKGH
jgi:hypothetical protein